MGAVQLTAAVAFVCLLLPDTAAQNLIKNPREQKTEHSLLINEINADNPGLDTWEFVELYHTSGHQAALDGYYLVFYNGNGNQAYKVLNLQGHVTNSQGFFLVGSHTVNPLPSMTLRPNTIQNGPDAIALYYGNGRYFEGMKVTNNGLVDALVHKSKKADKADTLLSVLTPDQDAFLEDPLFRSTDESLERCRGSDLQWFFQVAMPTPGRDNHCIPSSQLNASTVLISEISTVSTSEGLEFIELQGPPSTTLGDLVLVLIEGGAKEVYFFMDVYGKTSPDGVLLIGPAQSKTPVDLQFPQNASSPLFRAGPNAVALYLGNSSSFSLGTAASATNLLDALVYTSNRSTAPELLEILTPGRPIFYEDERHQQGDVSVSRCSCCSVTRDASAYALSSPTPGQFNDCPSKRFSQAISFCLHGADCQQWSPGSNEIQRVLAHSLDAQCNCGVSAVYFKDPTETCQGTEFRLTTLLTAKSAGQLSSLLQAFASFLESARTVPVATWNGTVEKACSKGTGVTNLPPGASTEKPGATPDPTSHHELLISEVNPDNPGGHEDNEYVELFYTGRVLFDLHDYWLVLYNGKNNQAYRVVNLTGHTTDEQGYFLLGSAGVSPKPMIVLPPNTIQNGGDGVALYHSSTHTYKAGMVVTEEGLVDAIVSTARESEKADKLLMVLTPGQSILYEDDSHSSQDESLSRCHGLKPRNQSSFQVTTITPLKENACLPPGASTSPPTPSTLVINELGLTNSTILYQFIELKGKPGTSLAGYILAFFSGQDSKAYASIPLRGTFGNEGLFVIAPEGQSRSDQLLPPLKDASSVRQGSSAVAVYHSPAAGIPIGSIATGENLVDAMAYTWESNTSRSQLDLFGPVRFMSSSWERPLSLSRCSCCNVTAALMYAISDPTPGLENSCPLKSFSVDLDMCLQTPNCSLWTQATVRMLDSLARALAKSMEESCSCGVSQCYLQGLHFTCVNSTLKLSGQVWARSQEQLHLITMWQRDFSTSPHPFPVEGRVLKTNTPCVNTESKTQSNSSFQAWGISLIVGSILFLLVLTGLALYYIKRRPQNYTTIEMNDRREIAADF